MSHHSTLTQLGEGNVLTFPINVRRVRKPDTTAIVMLEMWQSEVAHSSLKDLLEVNASDHSLLDSWRSNQNRYAQFVGANKIRKHHDDL